MSALSALGELPGRAASGSAQAVRSGAGSAASATIKTPAGDAPVIPILLMTLGGYLCWFGVHYWRDTQTLWPSSPVKDILTGHGLPQPAPPGTSAITDIAAAQQNAGTTQQSRADAANTAVASTAASGAPLAAGSAANGNAIAAEALKYRGHCYSFGGSAYVRRSATPSGGTGLIASCWDCSSFVNFVVGTRLKMSIPGFAHGSYDGTSHGPATGEWMTWTGCTNISRKNVRAGDIIVWPTHMGIAVSNAIFISAIDPQQKTAEDSISHGAPSSAEAAAVRYRRLRESVLAPQLGLDAKGGSKSKNMAIGKLLAAQYGWSTGQQWDDLVKLWDKESQWNEKATNPTSGAYGIPQALPASKMATAGADWKTSASTQIKWGLRYIRGRYGSPSKAWAHELANNWY